MAIRAFLAILCLANVGLVARLYDPKDEIPGAYWAIIGLFVLAHLALGAVALLRPVRGVLMAGAVVSGGLAVLQAAVWFIARSLSNTNPRDVAGVDSMLLPFLIVQAGIAICSLIAAKQVAPKVP